MLLLWLLVFTRKQVKMIPIEFFLKKIFSQHLNICQAVRCLLVLVIAHNFLALY